MSTILTRVQLEEIAEREKALASGWSSPRALACVCDIPALLAHEAALRGYIEALRHSLKRMLNTGIDVTPGDGDGRGGVMPTTYVCLGCLSPCTEHPGSCGSSIEDCCVVQAATTLNALIAAGLHEEETP